MFMGVAVAVPYFLLEAKAKWVIWLLVLIDRATKKALPARSSKRLGILGKGISGG
jgi:hypothetical protein